MKDVVALKVKRDRLKIYLDPEADFFQIKQSLLDKIVEVKNFVGKVKTAVEFAERIISDEEEDELLNLIRENSEMEITYVFSNGETDPKMKAVLNSLKGEGKVKFYKGILRSGSLLEYDGSVIIFGDVNPGGIVKAGDSVIVLGHLNGTVYAGTESGKDAFIGALYMNPIQLKIGEYIARNPNPQMENNKKSKKDSKFEIAYVNGENIFIENYNKDMLEVMLENDS